MEFIHRVSSLRAPTRKVIKRICWERPPKDWMKLNTNGSTNGDSRLVGYEKVIRDDCGR